MVSLEQIKLLESKVTRMIDYVKKVTEENNTLKNTLDANKKQIDQLEVLIQRFKEDQSQLEDGILSALDRLNQFEDALESTLSKGSSLPHQDENLGEVDSAPIGETSESAPEGGSGEELDIF